MVDCKVASCIYYWRPSLMQRQFINANSNGLQQLPFAREKTAIDLIYRLRKLDKHCKAQC